jgi:alpha-tubulin suppressor-like RCC1 family protein
VGQVFSFGDDRRIQLGLGDTRSTAADQRNAVSVLSREQLGGQKTATEMKRRVSYKYYAPHLTWRPTKTMEPKAVNRPAYPYPHDIAAGEDFTLFVIRDSPDWFEEDKTTSVVMACGENAEGQCGRNWQQQQQVWAAVRLPKYNRIDGIACGQGHSLALLTTGEVFAWGQNIHGQIGCGSRAPQCPPVRVWLEGAPPPRPRDQAGNPIGEREPVAPQPRVQSLACGFRASAIIALEPEEN